MGEKLSLSLKGVEAEIVHHTFRGVPVKTLLVKLHEKRRVLSTLQGFREVTFVANHYCPEALWDYIQGHCDEYRRWLPEALGVPPGELTSLWTGVDLQNMAVASRSFEDLTVVVLVTAGVRSNAQRLGEDRAGHLERCGGFSRLHGTINVVLLTNVSLTQGAMARALITITEAKTAALQDLLVHALKGLSLYADAGRAVGVVDKEVNVFTAKAMFSTLTNVDFDPERFIPLIQESVHLREALKEKVAAAGGKTDFTQAPANFTPADTMEGMVAQGEKAGLKSAPDINPDILSLQHTMLFGIKGAVSYTHLTLPTN